MVRTVELVDVVGLFRGGRSVGEFVRGAIWWAGGDIRSLVEIL